MVGQCSVFDFWKSNNTDFGFHPQQSFMQSKFLLTQDRSIVLGHQSSLKGYGSEKTERGHLDSQASVE